MSSTEVGRGEDRGEGEKESGDIGSSKLMPVKDVNCVTEFTMNNFVKIHTSTKRTKIKVGEDISFV